MSVLQLLKNIPFLRFTSALAGGILVSDYLQQFPLPVFGYSLTFTLLLMLVVFFVPYLFKRYMYRWIFGLLFFLFLFQTGILLAGFAKPSVIEGNHEVEATGKVTEADITISGYYRFTVKPLEIHAGHSVPLSHNDRWQIIVEPADSVEFLPAREGNIVCFKTELSGHTSTTNPVSFDYGKYLFRQGVSGTGFVTKDNFKVLPGGGFQGVSGQVKKMRHQTRQVYMENGIEDEELQVLSALTLGMRHELDDKVKERFVHSGAIHVLAVSGLHVGIVFIFLNLLLNTLLPPRGFMKMLIVVATLSFFALLTGGAPSVFRAVVMLSVIQVGNYFNRHGNIYNLLGISAFIILLVQPLSLYHAGFWLSHLAVAGIVTFYPVFRRFYAGGNIFVRGIGDLTAVSLSAQLGTFPLSVYLFRAFPSWFLLTNFLILPLVAPILVLTKLLVAFSGIPFVASMISGLLVDILGFMLEMVKWLDTLPAAYIQGLWMAPLTMVLLYLFISSFMIWEGTRLRLFFKLSLVWLLGVVIMFNYDYWAKRTTDALVVFDTGRGNSVGLVRSGQGCLFSDSTITRGHLNFACSGFFSKYANQATNYDIWADTGISDKVKVFPVAAGAYLGVGDVNVDKLKKKPGVNTGLLGVICMGDVKGDVAGLLERIDCPRLIINRTCPPWSIESFLEEVEDSGIEVHNVHEQGAYLAFY